MLPDRRWRLVQPATRGARTGAISARQAITRSSTRRRARLRPRQPARTTITVRRNLFSRVAASLSSVLAGSSSTPTRSAPASLARSCCAPVRPISLGRPRHRGVLVGTHGVLSGTHRGLLKARSCCAPVRPASHGRLKHHYRVLTGVLKGLLSGAHAVLWGPHAVLSGLASIAQLRARRRSTRHVGWVRAASLAGLEGLLQRVLWVLHCPLGYSWGTDDTHHFVRAWSTARG